MQSESAIPSSLVFINAHVHHFSLFVFTYARRSACVCEIEYMYSNEEEERIKSKKLDLKVVFHSHRELHDLLLHHAHICITNDNEVNERRPVR